MKTKHVRRLAVSMEGSRVGALASDERGWIVFQYDPGWLRAGFDIAPHTMRYVLEPQLAHDTTFDGLHGVFYDSLPDGWGLLLMDRALKMAFGWDRPSITMLDRLSYMGSRAMGALVYEPEIGPDQDLGIDLASLALAAETVMEGRDDQVLRALFIHGGSPGGARPKVTVARRSSDGACASGFRPLDPGFEHWMVKFRSRDDAIDTGRIEYAYSRMADAAGLQMPPAEIVEVDVAGRREAFFAVKRFDREGEKRIHMMSLCGHLHASHRMPSLGYEAILAATLRLTGSAQELRRAFRLMLFNAITHNRDDHSKNFAFLRRDGVWRMSPAFDLTMSEGMAGQHSSDINGSGDPQRKDVLALASRFSIGDASAITEQVIEAAGLWPKLASECGVSSEQSLQIGRLIDRMRSRLG